MATVGARTAILQARPHESMVPADVQREARALGDPTRHRLFRYIADAPGPVSVAELTGYAGLHHNAVRQHLALLKDARFVTEEVEHRGRPGRPRLLYRLHPEKAGDWESPGAYAWLAGMLSAAVRAGQSPRQAGYDEGRRLAAELSSGGDPADVVQDELARRGFRPERSMRGRRVEFQLGRCPFVDVAATDPTTICKLHLGLAEGLADGLGALRVERLVVKQATRAGCRVTFGRLGPARAGTAPGAELVPPSQGRR